MKIEFRFNSTNQLILTPEHKKDEQMIQLFVGGNKSIKFITPPASSPTSLVMESFNIIDEVKTKELLYTQELIKAADEDIKEILLGRT